MRGDFNDLTKGGVTKQLVRYAIPMVVTSLLQACYSMADLLNRRPFYRQFGDICH